MILNSKFVGSRIRVKGREKIDIDIREFAELEGVIQEVRRNPVDGTVYWTKFDNGSEADLYRREFTVIEEEVHHG